MNRIASGHIRHVDCGQNARACKWAKRVYPLALFENLRSQRQAAAVARCAKYTVATVRLLGGTARGDVCL